MQIASYQNTFNKYFIFLMLLQNKSLAEATTTVTGTVAFPNYFS